MKLMSGKTFFIIIMVLMLKLGITIGLISGLIISEIKEYNYWKDVAALQQLYGEENGY